jgi:HTH-type transcriptional regulator, glycine betaine synthesis regulator
MARLPAKSLAGPALSPAEARVGEVVGRLMEFWGFRRNMGRIWTVLYLSPHELSAEDLRRLLGLSTGAVSMTLTELLRWGVVRKVWVQGERKDFFTAEVQLWKMISRVISERERAEVAHAIEAFESALAALEDGLRSADLDVRAKAELQHQRIAKLLEFAKLGKTLIEALLTTSKLDFEPMVKLFSIPFAAVRSRSHSSSV